ncbi:MAG: recombinase family protein [Clostridiales bacterium]|nr:recombinase family protein [Clostridiales bacterium]MDR2750633.1 recombinase family protein [Clostridiales bacterium]
MGTTYGYVRVSTREQKTDRQLAAMEEFGVPKDKVYVDKQSGKDFNRPGYQRLLKRVKPGDAVVIKSIDRLGRNYDEIKEQWRLITKTKRCAIVVLDMPLLDTRENHADLTGKFIADLVLEILSYVAETERQMIKKRQAEGIAAAKAKGIKFGRPATQPSDLFFKLLPAWQNKEISAKAAADLLGMSYKTFITLAKGLAP